MWRTECRTWREHILTDCGMTEDAVEAALTSIEPVRGEAAAVAVKDMLRAAASRHNYESRKHAHALALNAE